PPRVRARAELQPLLPPTADPPGTRRRSPEPAAGRRADLSRPDVGPPESARHSRAGPDVSGPPAVPGLGKSRVETLAAVAIVPFSAGLLGAYWREPPAVSVFGAKPVPRPGTLLWVWGPP